MCWASWTKALKPLISASFFNLLLVVWLFHQYQRFAGFGVDFFLVLCSANGSTIGLSGHHRHGSIWANVWKMPLNEATIFLSIIYTWRIKPLFVWRVYSKKCRNVGVRTQLRTSSGVLILANCWVQFVLLFLSVFLVWNSSALVVTFEAEANQPLTCQRFCLSLFLFQFYNRTFTEMEGDTFRDMNETTLETESCWHVCQDWVRLVFNGEHRCSFSFQPRCGVFEDK